MSAVIDPNNLAALPLFHNLTREQFAHISGLLHRKTFPAGSMLMTAEQPGEVAYMILTGTVKVHVEQADGSDVILAILGAGQLVGELSLIEQQVRSATVATLEESTLLWIDRVAWQQCLETMPTLTLNLVRMLARRLRLANAQIQALATQDVFGRVARQLLAFTQEYGQPQANGGTIIPLRLTQSELVSLVGASRVRVNQVLSFYQQRRLIAIHPNHHITILDAGALAQRCQ
jgi:CRP/FNR family cyclic AMP-dependent transcriptional regulator